MSPAMAWTQTAWGGVEHTLEPPHLPGVLFNYDTISSVDHFLTFYELFIIFNWIYKSIWLEQHGNTSNILLFDVVPFQGLQLLT